MAYVNDSAQEETAVDPELRKQIEAVLMKFDERITNTTRLLSQRHTLRTVLNSGRGGRSIVAMASGRQAIEKRFAGEFATSLVTSAWNSWQRTPVENSPLSDFRLCQV